IDHQRPVRGGEQFTQPDGSGWCVAGIEVSRSFQKLVIFQDSTSRKVAAQFRYAFPLAHSVPLRPSGALRAWLDTRPIRSSGSFGGMCLRLSRGPFALSLIHYFLVVQ